MRPLGEHVPRPLGIQPLGLAHADGLLQGELVGQEREEVPPPGTGLRFAHILAHRPGDGIAKERHLARHVVREAPAHERLQRLVPLPAIRHIKDARLEVRNHVGAEREVLIHPVLREAGRFGVLLLHPLGEPVSLGALDEPRGARQALDIGTELLVERGVIRAIYGHLRPDFPLRYRTEVDARDGAVGQYLREIALPLEDCGGRVPIKADGDLLGDGLRPHARLPVPVPRVEREAYDLELLASAPRPAQGVELVYLVQLRIEEMALGLGRTEDERRVRHVRVNLLDDQPLGPLALVLVRPLRVHLGLPFPLAAQVLGVPEADIRHDAVDGLGDAILARARARHEDVHQGGLVLHIVDVPEPHVVQVGAQGREHRVGHGRLIDVRRAANQELYQRRELVRHFGKLKIES